MEATVQSSLTFRWTATTFMMMTTTTTTISTIHPLFFFIFKIHHLYAYTEKNIRYPLSLSVTVWLFDCVCASYPFQLVFTSCFVWMCLILVIIFLRYSFSTIRVIHRVNSFTEQEKKLVFSLSTHKHTDRQTTQVQSTKITISWYWECMWIHFE